MFVLSAPTGFGKTATIIYGLVLAGVERVLYLVRTRNEIAPVLRELRRFGLGDYVFLYSARRMCPLMRSREMGVRDFWEACRALRLRGACSYYEELAREDIEDTVAELVGSSDSPFRVVEALAAAGVCPFFALRLLVPGSRFIVATYPYLFRRDVFEAALEPLEVEDLVVVVDEAHSLLSPSGLGEVRVDHRGLVEAEREAREHGFDELAERLARLREALQGLRGLQGLRRLPRSLVEETLGSPSVWGDAAYEVRLRRLREALEEGGEPPASRLARIEELAEAAGREGYGVYAFSDERGVGVAALPLDPCVVAEPLARAKAVVLASGTMPPADVVRDALCLQGRSLAYYDVELVHGRIRHGDAAAAVLTEVTSRYTSRSPSMYRLYALYLLETLRAVRKSVLAVYPSYDFMQSVVSALEALDPGVQLYTEDRGSSLDEALEAARRSKTLINAVAGGKLTEGVEFLGEDGRSLVGTVFIAGVPYPQPDDYLEDQLRHVGSRLGPAKARLLLFDVAATVKTRQAIGRAQRGPGDNVLVVLADQRWLRRRLLQLLRPPASPVALHSLAEYRVWLAGEAQALGV